MSETYALWSLCTRVNFDTSIVNWLEYYTTVASLYERLDEYFSRRIPNTLLSMLLRRNLHGKAEKPRIHIFWVLNAQKLACEKHKAMD
jgi:hypothetical protein